MCHYPQGVECVGRAGYIGAYRVKCYLMKGITLLLWIIAVQFRMVLQSLVRT